MMIDPRISTVPSCADCGANPAISPHPSGKQNRAKVECLSRTGTHHLDLSLSQVGCPDIANLIIFDALYLPDFSWPAGLSDMTWILILSYPDWQST